MALAMVNSRRILVGGELLRFVGSSPAPLPPLRRGGGVMRYRGAVAVGAGEVGVAAGGDAVGDDGIGEVVLRLEERGLCGEEVGERSHAGLVVRLHELVVLLRL